MYSDTKLQRRWFLLIIAGALAGLMICSLPQSSHSQNYADLDSEEHNYVPLEWFAYEPDINNFYEQRVDISVKEATFEEVLQEISRKANIRLAYDRELLPDGSISLSYSDISLVNLFEILISGSNMEALASANGQVILTPRDMVSEEQTQQEQPEEITVNGRIISSDDQEALPGVNIRVKGTSVGTSTNIEGEYTITAPSPADTLVYTYLGYETREEPIEGREEIDVSLVFTSIVGDEVVVVGYGDARRRDISGSVSSVTAEQISQSQSTSFEKALQGRAAGVMVMSNTGQPGGGSSVRIRGTNTLTGGAEPLYVIDGVPISAESDNSTNPLATLNPSDIESIDVLKDASAAAIYGARAANGVIMVTTKRGEAGQTNVDYDGSYGIQQLPGTLDVMNLREYAEYHNRRADIAGFGHREEFSDPSILGEGTNWQEEIFQTAPMQQHNLSVSGGDEVTRYRLSVGYLDQDGIAFGSNFKRYSARINLDNNPSEWLEVGTSLNLSRTSEEITVSESDQDLINTAIRQTPDIPLRTPEGDWGGPAQAEFTLVNPVAMAQIEDNHQNRAQMQGNIFANLILHDNFSFRTEISGAYNLRNQKQFMPSYEFGERVNQINSSHRSKDVFSHLQGRAYADYSNTFVDMLRVNLMGGYEAEVQEYEGLSGNRDNFPTNNVPELGAGDAATMANNSWAGSSSIQSFFTRVNLDYDSRYILNSSLRVDGSSRFAPDNRWGVFPSFSGAWRISSEPFFNIAAFDELKLRAGYGFVGNQEIGNYLFGSSLQITATAWGSGVRPANHANPDLRWESTESANLGLDVSLFRDRINLTADTYIKWTRDLLLEQPLPLYSGTSGIASIGAPTVNLGSLENKGIELALNTINTDGEFRWESRIVYTMNRNQVTEMDQETSFIERQIEFFDSVSRTMVGEPVGTFYGYKTDGVFEDAEDIRNHAEQHQNIHPGNGVWPGDLKFKDLNGDGVIDENDRTVIGDPNPDFQFGITNEFFYRDFDMSIFLNGSYGNDVFNQVRRNNENLASNFNLLSTVNDHARVELHDPEGNPNDVENVYVSNPDTDVPRITNADPNSNNRISDRFVEDGSYIRIQNVTLGYNLPPSLLNRLDMRSFRIYASVDNLYTITGYSGFDPEVGSQMQNPDPLLIGVDHGRYPSQRIFTFGLSIGI